MGSMRAGVQASLAVARQVGLMQVQGTPWLTGTSLEHARGYADCGAKEGKKKTMTICQAPPSEPKVIPPYEYGYCREPDPEPPTGCPVIKKKEEKKEKTGPCCKGGKKGGCRN